MTIRPFLTGLGLLSAVPALFAGGEVSFGPPVVITASALGAQAVTVADVDGDGDLDAIAASFDDDTVAWYENLDGAGGSWTEHLVSTTVDGASAVIAVDLDADGDVDLASAAGTSGVISWHENLDGAGGSWAAHLVSDSVAGARSVAAGDIDGDGDLDLASASFDADTIAWHDNLDGAGTAWLKRAVTTGADGATAVLAADLDLDGDIDLASASANDDTLAWYESFDGTGTAWIERTITTAADGAAALALADVNGDGRPDLLAASELDDTVAWYRNNGTAALFRGEIVISGLADGARGVAAADVDGDGDTDALSASSNDGTIAWHENTDSLGGAWTAHPISAAAGGARSVAAGDIDDDGKIDALSAAFDIDTVAWYQNGGDGGGPPPPPEGGPGLDLKPGNCPNVFNAKSHGVLTAVIVGTEDLDATQIDVGSLRLGRADGDGETIAPITGPPGPHPQIHDVSTAPGRADVCECVPAGPDGRPDLVLKFDSDELAHELGLLGLPKNTTVRLELSGELFDDTPFAVEDCLLLVNS
jgi:hypothetical protein